MTLLLTIQARPPILITVILTKPEAVQAMRTRAVPITPAHRIPVAVIPAAAAIKFKCKWMPNITSTRAKVRMRRSTVPPACARKSQATASVSRDSAGRDQSQRIQMQVFQTRFCGKTKEIKPLRHQRIYQFVAPSAEADFLRISICGVPQSCRCS